MDSILSFTDVFGNTGAFGSTVLVDVGPFKVRNVGVDYKGKTVVYDEFTPYTDFYIVPSGLKRQLNHYRYGKKMGHDSCGNKLQLGDLVLLSCYGKLKFGIVYSNTQVLVDMGVTEVLCVMLLIPKTVWRKTEKDAYAKLMKLNDEIQRLNVGYLEPERGNI